MARLPIHQILCAQVRGSYVTIHAKEDYTVRKTLGELEAALDGSFYRVGRSAIVNLSAIRRVTKQDIYLRDGSMVPLSRGAYEGINRAITAHS